jgi:hypothetical protein
VDFEIRSAEWKIAIPCVIRSKLRIPHSAFELVGRHGAAPCSAV